MEKRLNPENMQEAIQTIDRLVGQINAFPEEPRLYRELYEAGKSSLKFLEEKITGCIIHRKTIGWLWNSYLIDFEKRIFFNELFVMVPLAEQNKVIHIRERRLLHRQPVIAYVYECRKDLSSHQLLYEVELDQWWGYGGEDDYRREQ